MRTYLIETYLARSHAGELEGTVAVLRAAARELRRQGSDVRYVRSTFLPDDETCFHVVQGPSLIAVRGMLERAVLVSYRIVEAVEDPPAPD